MLTQYATNARFTGRDGLSSIMVVAAMVLVILVAAGAWMFAGRNTAPVSQDAGMPVAEQFLRLIREGTAAEAWASTTAEFKSAEGQESFLRSVRSRPYLSEELQFDAMAVVDMNGQPRGEFRFKSKDGKSVTVIVGSEPDGWKVDWWTAE